MVYVVLTKVGKEFVIAGIFDNHRAALDCSGTFKNFSYVQHWPLNVVQQSFISMSEPC